MPPSGGTGRGDLPVLVGGEGRGRRGQRHRFRTVVGDRHDLPVAERDERDLAQQRDRRARREVESVRGPVVPGPPEQTRAHLRRHDVTSTDAGEGGWGGELTLGQIGTPPDGAVRGADHHEAALRGEEHDVVGTRDDRAGAGEQRWGGPRRLRPPLRGR
ncbi:hypothetical protein [Mobilicoccus caccae]|uniref:hypothetical protein n=1 Tax=Mobilicoccus caccae TaxID=1859295 RepID=UPI0024E0695F|nr:hypothetical protein [Mobilicoccus caccae]